MLYNIVVETTSESTTLKMSFGDPATNAEIIKEVIVTCEAIKPQVMNGKILLLNGPASLPVACAISHAFAHLVPAVACFDPKLGGYVVAISHSPNYEVGSIISL
jgi:CRISPR-associated protein Csx3